MKEAGHADKYEGLTVTFVGGASPSLTMEGSEEKIDLTGFTTDQLVWLTFYSLILKQIIISFVLCSTTLWLKKDLL